MNLELLGEEDCGCVLANPLVLERREPGREETLAATLGTPLLDDSLSAHGMELQQQEISFCPRRMHCLSEAAFRSPVES